MRRYFIFLINVIFLSHISIAQNYFSNDSLYVWAVSGLNMRTTPDLKGDKIKTVPYGTKVSLEGSYGEALTLKVIGPQNFDGQTFAGFKIRGSWIKISYQDTSGYVYGSYLSKYPPIQLLEKEYITNQKEFQPKEYITEWAERNFGVLKIVEEKDSIRENSVKKIIYGNGMVYSEFSGYENVGEVITIPNISFNEGYLLLNILNQLEEPVTETNPIGVRMINDSELKIAFGSECSIGMKSFANTIVYYSECSY